MFTLATVTLPAMSLARSSRAGPIILQGPHHSAQKSTRTGSADFKTSVSKLASVTAFVAMEGIFRLFGRPVVPLTRLEDGYLGSRSRERQLCLQHPRACQACNAGGPGFIPHRRGGSWPVRP